MAINGVSVNNTNEEHINYDAVENRISSADYNKTTNVLTFRDEEGTQKFNVEIEQDTLELDTTLAKTGYAADAKAVGDEIDRVENAIPSIDSTLSVNGDAADAGATGALIVNAMNQVTEGFNDAMDAYLIENAYGQMYVDENNGLHISAVTPDSETVITDAVEDWLDDHPEATTTVQDDSLTTAKYQDGSVTENKLESSLQGLSATNENFSRLLNDDTWQSGEGSNAIFACAASWLRNNDKLYYGSDKVYPNNFKIVSGEMVPISEPIASEVVDGKFPLVCQSFVEMCLRGIGFEESAWGDGSNTVRYPSASYDWNSWDFGKYSTRDKNTISSRPIIDSNINSYEDRGYWGVTTWEFARYLRDHGLYTSVISKTDRAQRRGLLRTGDIIFFGNPNDSSFSNRFEGIYHSAIFVGWSRGDQPIVIDCTSADTEHPIRVRESSEASHNYSKIVGYARIPLGNAIANGAETCMDLRVPSGMFNNKLEGTEHVFLRNKISQWDIYKFTVAFMYTNANDIPVAFPAVLWTGRGTGYTQARLTVDTQIAKEANKWYICDLIVIMDEDDVEFSQYTPDEAHNHFRLQFNFYGTRVGDGYIKCLKVEPILLNSTDYMSDGYVLLEDTYSSNSFASMSDVATFLYNTYADKLNICQTLRFRFNSVVVNGSATSYINAKILKVRSDCVKVAVWNNTLTGAVLFKKFNVTEPEITTYTSTNTFPIEQWLD